MRDCRLTSKDLEFRQEGSRGIDGLCKMAELLGYDHQPRQFFLGNGACVSDLLNLFEDNPGAIEAVIDWVRENFADEIATNDNEQASDEEGDSVPGI